MYHLIVLQVLCGFFSAFVAVHKGRGRLAWWLIGALLPILGVVLILRATDRRTARRPGMKGPRADQQARLEPKRCRGSYIADCLGCPYFRRPLFDPSPAADRKGHCDLFHKDLFESREDVTSKVTIEKG